MVEDTSFSVEHWGRLTYQEFMEDAANLFKNWENPQELKQIAYDLIRIAVESEKL